MALDLNQPGPEDKEDVAMEAKRGGAAEAAANAAAIVDAGEDPPTRISRVRQLRRLRVRIFDALNQMTTYMHAITDDRVSEVDMKGWEKSLSDIAESMRQ